MAHVHVANSHEKDAQVFISKRIGWQLIDIVADAASFAAGLGELKAVTSIRELPAAMNTVEDLYTTLRIIAKTLKGTARTGTGSANAVRDFIDLFRRNSIAVVPHTFKDVMAVRGLDWMKPSSIAGMVGADTFNMTVLTDDGEKVINFNTNQDHSWIVTDPSVVRAKYGHIWIPDAKSGEYKWETGSSRAPKPVAEHGGFLWRVRNDTRFQLAFWPEVHAMKQITNREGTFGRVYNPDKGDYDESPGLEPGRMNGWGECWNFDHYTHSDCVYFDIRLTLNTSNAVSYDNHQSFASFHNEAASFKIPKKWIYGSEMTAIIRRKENHTSSRMHDSDLEIVHPTFGRTTIPESSRS